MFWASPLHVALFSRSGYLQEAGYRVFLPIPCILPDAQSWSVYLYIFFLYILAIHTLSASTVVSLLPEQLGSRPSCLAGPCLYIYCLREWKKSCLFQGVEHDAVPAPLLPGHVCCGFGVNLSELQSLGGPKPADLSEEKEQGVLSCG